MYKVAIIDDEQSILSMLQDGLSKNGRFQITAFSNPLMAVSAIKPTNVDVVLCDIVMPQMDGIEVLDKLKTKHPELKIIMMTGKSTLDRVLSSHKTGADNYILKPFNSISEIEQKILSVLQ